MAGEKSPATSWLECRTLSRFRVCGVSAARDRGVALAQERLSNDVGEDLRGPGVALFRHAPAYLVTVYCGRRGVALD